MFGLRQKLLLSFSGLLVILLVVSGLGITLSIQHRRALNRFLYENWRSVEYGQNMVDALDRLGDIARRAAGDNGSAGEAELAAARAAAAGPLAAFDKNLDDENHNLTLPGEPELAGRLSLLWRGQDAAGGGSDDALRSWYAKLLDPAATPEGRARAVAAVERLTPQVKAAARAVIKLNFDNMTPVEGQAKAMSDRAVRLLFLLTGAGVALAVLFTAVMGRLILRPVKALTRSAREIEQGNLDLVVQVRSRDELHDLAEAFNSMTAKLREYRRSDRAKLVRTQRTTQLAVDSLPDAVALIDPGGRVELANESARRLFGLKPDGNLSDGRVEALDALHRRVARGDRLAEPQGYESAIQVLDENGRERFFLPRAVPIVDSGAPDRPLVGVTLVLADVTNLRRLDEMKSGMLSVVSHELKTPLTSIRMATHLLLEERVGPLTGQQAELLVAAREDSDRLQRIIDDLLDMGRIQSGGVKMDLHPTPAAGVVREAAEAFEAACQNGGVGLSIEVPGDAPDVLVDRTRISHVLWNLLTNALKHTPPGGRVRVAVEPVGKSEGSEGGAGGADEEVRFSVSDTGEGIPQEYLGRIFERFFRVPNQTAQGAGLGLAIAREIVEAHGGRISVASGEGRGSTFSFTLRRAPAGAPGAPREEGAASERTAASHETDASRQAGVRADHGRRGEHPSDAPQGAGV